ncbi:Uncharacterized protein BP5553_06900 [Venustampulla echinocandica]|uniref:Glycosyltransferase 2-like domain-containing protein n=1 Tax=Venustampulla echinocandica TaxID=2656787 RepID=A0A370THZ0_9HELO|nr:Uncharacterized protein BP5553_06900 [Venustampulla echinocandica]RDL34969.1 Uncharacterized protein BP5553_06900 [Venustampulla echinocandica]
MSYLARIPLWCTQRVTSLVLVALWVLIYIALWRDRPRPSAPPPPQSKISSWLSKGKKSSDHVVALEPTNAQLVFVCYTLAAHILGLLFPMRLLWATRSITKKLNKIFNQSHATSDVLLNYPNPADADLETKLETGYGYDGYESTSSYSESDSVTEVDEANELILHAIVIPNYKEDVYLAMEAGESGASTKAAVLMKEFADQFREIGYTLHPSDLPGEAQGKSSNLCWAAKHVNGKYLGGHMKRNVIVTVIDSDSHLSSKYFSLINGMHFRYPETAETTIYVPPIIFDRNAHHVPTPVRVADLLWAGAGLSGHYDTSSICPPTSVYSLPLSLVDQAGGWDAGEEAVGEDLHMYVKCFFALDGKLTTRTVLSPASQSNVHTDGKGIRGFFRDCKARYRQALRHMWGALDSGYVAKCVSKMWWRSLGRSGGRPHWGNTMVLLHRMYEAHFLPTHITFLIIGGAIYTVAVPAEQIPPLLQQTLSITAYMRLMSIFNFGMFFYLYEGYHYVCVKGREEEMVRVGLADRMSGAFSYRTMGKNCLDYCFFPIAGVAFGSVPTTVALLCHFWTLRLVYKVTKKPPSAVSTPA